MKTLKLVIFAVAAMIGLSGCDKSNNIDYTQSIVGTWIYCQEDGFESLTINADGSLLSHGMENEEYWKGVKGNWTLDNNKLVMNFEDNDNFDGTIEVVAGHTLALIADGNRHVYDYAEKTLPSKLVGTWSVNEDSWVETLVIKADGSVTSTGNDGEESWENLKGNIQVAHNSIYVGFEDNDDFAGKYEVVSGETLVLINIVSGTRVTYKYAK